jgi:prepilin peptidase CpaA
MIHALQIAAVMAFPALVIVGALTDLASFRIPNWVSLSLVAAFAPAAVLGLVTGDFGYGAAGLQLATGAAGLGVGILLFALGWIGGGDAKLFAAAALWVGWPALATFLGATCLAGGALALVLLGMRSTFVRPLALAGPAWMARLAEPGEAVPYGVAIAAGALTAFPASTLAQAVRIF